MHVKTWTPPRNIYIYINRTYIILPLFLCKCRSMWSRNSKKMSCQILPRDSESVKRVIDTRSVFRAEERKIIKKIVFLYGHLVSVTLKYHRKNNFLIRYYSWPLYKGHLGDTKKWPFQRSLNKSHCVWTVRQKGGRCGEVAVSEGSTVLLILNWYKPWRLLLVLHWHFDT